MATPHIDRKKMIEEMVKAAARQSKVMRSQQRTSEELAEEEGEE